MSLVVHRLVTIDGAADVRLERATRFLLLALIAGGIALRVYDLGYPSELTWDEHHFVKNARNLLDGHTDRNDHPPLGKLLIAVGMIAMGDGGTGWRLVPLLCGLALIALAYFLAASAFRSKAAGLYAAAFIAASGFALAFSKTALLDGMLATSMVAAALAIWRARSWPGIVLAAVLVGLSASIKFTGIVFLAPLMLVTIWRLGVRPKTIGVVILALAVVVGVYVAQFSFGLALAGNEHGLVDVFKKTTSLFSHHIGLTDWKHRATSRWYTWFIPLKAIRLHYARDGNTVRALSTFGNPILWWGVNLAVLGSSFQVLRRLRKGVSALGSHNPPWGLGQGYLLLLWFLPLCPWILTNRDSYLYHYLPSYVFGLILFGALVSTLANAKARFAIVGLVALVFAYCAPVWSKIPLDADSLLHRLFFR